MRVLYCLLQRKKVKRLRSAVWIDLFALNRFITLHSSTKWRQYNCNWNLPHYFFQPCFRSGRTFSRTHQNSAQALEDHSFVEWNESWKTFAVAIPKSRRKLTRLPVVIGAKNNKTLVSRSCDYNDHGQKQIMIQFDVYKCQKLMWRCSDFLSALELVYSEIAEFSVGTHRYPCIDCASRMIEQCKIPKLCTRWKDLLWSTDTHVCLHFKVSASDDLTSPFVRNESKHSKW